MVYQTALILVVVVAACFGIIAFLHVLYDPVYAWSVNCLEYVYDSIQFYLFSRVGVTNTLSSSRAQLKISLNSSGVKTPDSIPIS